MCLLSSSSLLLLSNEQIDKSALLDVFLTVTTVSGDFWQSWVTCLTVIRMQLVPLIHENMFCLFFCLGRSSVVSDLDNIFFKRRYFNKGHPAGQVVKMCCVSRVTRSKAKFVERVWPEGREKMRIQKVDIKGCYIVREVLQNSNCWTSGWAFQSSCHCACNF